MDNKTKNREIKFWLKRVEPLDYDEVEHTSRIGYAYTMTEPSKNYLYLEKTIMDNNDPVDEFGIWLAKFYKYEQDVNVAVFYHNLKLVYDKERRIRKIEMFKYE